jgi:hypothetical protein
MDQRVVVKLMHVPIVSVPEPAPRLGIDPASARPTISIGLHAVRIQPK